MLRRSSHLYAVTRSPATQMNLRSIVNCASGSHPLSLSAWKHGGLKSLQKNMTNTCAACLTASLKQAPCPSSRPRRITLRATTASTPPSHRSHMNTIFRYGTSGLAVQPLADHGLSGDGFHLTFARNFFDDRARMKSAWPWRNLTALQTLDAVHKGLTRRAAIDFFDH